MRLTYISNMKRKSGPCGWVAALSCAKHRLEPPPFSSSRSQSLKSLFLAQIYPQSWIWHFLLLSGAFLNPESLLSSLRKYENSYLTYTTLLTGIKHHSLACVDFGSICFAFSLLQWGRQDAYFVCLDISVSQYPVLFAKGEGCEEVVVTSIWRLLEGKTQI